MSLSEKITQKFDRLKEEREESDKLKDSWIKELQSIARKQYPNCSLVLTGSSANMFGFTKSDCDLTLMSTGERFISSATALEKIERLLPKSKFTTEVKIVKFIYRVRGNLCIGYRNAYVTLFSVSKYSTFENDPTILYISTST